MLGVISYSPGELEPVFRAMLENATRICGANFASLFRLVNGELQVLSALNIPPALTEFLRDGNHRLTEFNAFLRVSVSRKPLHITDYRLDEAYLTGDPIAVAGVELGTIRTLLIVPLLRDNELVGTFGIFRQEVLPFTDKQIALVQNFAAQAVIAIENTRLLNELRQRTHDLTESLEQQTATSEVLRVISSSPGELEPVFQAMLENAVRICEAKFGTLYLVHGSTFHFGADVGTPPQYAEFQRRRGPYRPTSGTHFDRILQTKRVQPERRRGC